MEVHFGSSVGGEGTFCIYTGKHVGVFGFFDGVVAGERYLFLTELVSHKIFIFDNLHVQVAFRPTAQKYSHMWFVVYLLYNDKEIFFEPQGVQVESNGFSEETQEKLKELFVDGCCQELTFAVYKAKNFISDVLEYMTKHESSFEYGDTSSN